MKYNLLIIISLLIFSCTNSQVKEIGRIIPAKEFAEEIKQENIEIIDVRTPKEYNSAHIENAKNIDVMNQDDFIKQIKLLDKEKPVYIYCRTGSRSKVAATILDKEGFKNIIDLEGGYLSWKAK